MQNLNGEFFDEYKNLDNICRDIYGRSADNKLGVTLYLEDMDKNYSIGYFRIHNWEYDYRKLKKIRNLRNELAHSSHSFNLQLCTQDDVYYIKNFKQKILTQSDPISLLHKSNKVSTQHFVENNTDETLLPSRTYSSPYHQNPIGCLTIVLALAFILFLL